MKKTLLITFLLLMLLTVVSVIISSIYFDHKYAVPLIIILATLKFIGISFYFMELRKAHFFWKASTLIFIFLFSLFVLIN